MKLSLSTHSEDQTIFAGIEFSKQLIAGTAVALFGDLGTGKTRFIKGICRGLGVEEHVSSPTFTIVNEYHGKGLDIFHFDFYRLRAHLELQEIGFNEYINGSGICLIEWADRVKEFLPSYRYDVHMKLGATEVDREIAIEEIGESSRV